jgi:hypothetical protein
MLTDEVIRSLAGGEDAVYHFDFSTILAEFYEPLFRTLQHFSLNKIDSLGFNCDALARAEQQALTGKPLPVQVLNSIAKTRSHFLNNVVALLSYILPKSPRILEIVLSHLNFQGDHFDRFVIAASRSSSLRALYLSSIRVGTDGVRALLGALDPCQIQAITLHSCGVGRDSVGDILAFIARRGDRSVEPGGIRRFQVTGPNLPAGDEQRIVQALGVATVLSPRAKATGDIRKRLEAIEEQREVSELEELERENAELKAELARLRQSINAVQFREDVFIVGKGAEEFVQFLMGIEEKLETFEAQVNRRKK